LHLSFETAAAERAGDFSIGKKKGLGPGSLRARPFGIRNEGERKRLVGGGGKLFVESDHAEVLTRRVGVFKQNIPTHQLVHLRNNPLLFNQRGRTGTKTRPKFAMEIFLIAMPLALAHNGRPAIRITSASVHI
jgi:hypothetical protein